MKKIFLFSLVFSLMTLTVISCGRSKSSHSSKKFVPDERILGDWLSEEVFFLPMVGTSWTTNKYNFDDKGNYVWEQEVYMDTDTPAKTKITITGKYTVEDGYVTIPVERDNTKVEFFGYEDKYPTEEDIQQAIKDILDPVFDDFGVKEDVKKIIEDEHGEIYLMDPDGKKTHRIEKPFIETIKGVWTKGDDKLQLKGDGTFRYDMEIKDYTTGELQFKVIFKGKYTQIWANAFEAPMSIDNCEIIVNDEYYPEGFDRDLARDRIRQVLFNNEPMVKRRFCVVNDEYEGMYLDDNGDFLSDYPPQSYSEGWHRE